VLGVALGVIVSSALYGALGVSLGALLRNQTAAFAVVLTWLLAIEGIIGDVFHNKEFVRWLPIAAARDIVDAGTTAGSLPASVAAVVFSAYVAGFAIAATCFTIQRDVT
jgi:ABC-2 type transport system permease protein